jgi:GT2 family glycosyltransferase
VSAARRARYSAIVATFRREASLGRVLESLAAQTIAPALLVVADNDPERSAEKVVAAFTARSAFPAVYLALRANFGPAGAWARAAAAAAGRLDRGTWLLVVDDDDPLGHPELVERLLRSASALEHPARCGAVGLRGARLCRHLAKLVRIEGAESRPARADYLASGAVPLYRWSALDEVGFFDERLFFGFEDLDQGLRLRSAGWDLWAVPHPSLHRVAESSPERVAWREYYKTRALVFIVRKQLGAPAVAVTLVRSAVLGSLRLVLTGHGWSLAAARFRGAIDGFRGHLGVGDYAPATNAAKPLPR